MSQKVTGLLGFEFGYLEPDSNFDRYIEAQKKMWLERRTNILDTLILK